MAGALFVAVAFAGVAFVAVVVSAPVSPAVASGFSGLDCGEEYAEQQHGDFQWFCVHFPVPFTDLINLASCSTPSKVDGIFSSVPTMELKIMLSNLSKETFPSGIDSFA